ncbi:MAG TPA: VWA domain-containing protein [Planctomycetota bacterium]|nr:VWA domain-containing protein [Planctomycetota bacterium]
MMKSPRRVFVLALSLLAVFGSAAAASAAPGKIEFGDQGPPTAVEQNEKKQAIPLAVIADGAPLLASPSLHADIVGRAGFLDIFWVARRSADRAYLLAVTLTPDDKVKDVLGWVRTSDVLETFEAQKTRDEVHRKALVVNRWTGGAGARGIECRNGPGVRSDGKPYDRVIDLAYFYFTYIYQEQEINGIAYYLLGNRPAIAERDNARGSIYGWVKADGVQVWDTREAIQWRKDNVKRRERSGGASVFETIDELRLWNQGIRRKKSGEAIEPIMRERLSEGAWPFSQTRFPLLGVVPASGAEGELLRIGVVGDQVSETGEHRPAVQRDLDSDGIEQVRGALRTVDILFVIDSTGSMEKYFAAAAEACRKIIDGASARLAKAESKNLRMGVVFYRDYCDETDPELKQRSYLTSCKALTSDVDAVRRFISEETCTSGGGGDDITEAVFHGMKTALDSAGFADGSWRVLVLIGDDGNHPDDPRGYTEQTIAAELKTKDCRFFAVHAVPSDRLRDPGPDLFRDQVRQILKAMGEADPQSHYVNVAVADGVAEAISTSALSAVKRSSQSLEALNRIAVEGRGIADVSKGFDTEIMGHLLDLLKKKGIDVAAYQKSSAQIFAPGYVSTLDPGSGEAQTTPMVLLSQREVEKLISYLGDFLETRGKANLQRAWQEALTKNLGEDPDENVPVAELVHRRRGLPIRSRLLQLTLEEIAKLPSDRINELYTELDDKLEQLRMLAAERDVVVQRVTQPDGSTTRVVEERGNGVRKLWFQRNEVKFGWFRLEDLP